MGFNFIWALHPLLSKHLLSDFSLFEVVWLRYATTLLGYWGVLGVVRVVRRAAGAQQAEKAQEVRRGFFLTPKAAGWSDFIWLGVLGGLVFCCAPLAQMAGLSLSLASENSVIVALEPLLTAFLAWLILGERLSGVRQLAFVLAFLGFLLLAGRTATFEAWDPHQVGNSLMLLSVLAEASFSILGGRLIRLHSATGIFGTSLAWGVLLLTLLLGFKLNFIFFFHSLIGVSWRSALALMWIGPLGTGIGYWFYLNALKEVPVITATLFLFVQPIVGSVLSYWLLGERLLLRQKFGEFLMILAIVVFSAAGLRKRSIH